MRYKIILASAVVFGMLFGPEIGDRIEVAESAKNVEKIEKTAKDLDESKCYGEALNTTEKNGEIHIYLEANRGSSELAALKDYDKVEVLEVVPYGWLKVKLKGGEEGYVESSFISMDQLPPHDYGVREEGYTIHYSEKKQLLTLYKDGEVVLKSRGSSGVRDQFTPKGVFRVDKGLGGEEAYASEFGQGYRYYTSFYEAGYLIHSVPFSEEGYVIPEENRKLGSPASHGCIRLPIPVAKYLYDNVSDKALVIIE